VRESLLKMTQVMDALSLSRSTVIRLQKTGELPCVRVGTAVRWKESTIRQYVEKLGAQNERQN
jgi:excisionase family DNA binding protein